MKYPLCFVVGYVQPVTQQYEYRSTSNIKIVTMTNTDDFRYEGKPSRAIAKSTLFALSKDEWDTKEDTEECIVHTAVCQKAPVGPK